MPRNTNQNGHSAGYETMPPGATITMPAGDVIKLIQHLEDLRNMVNASAGKMDDLTTPASWRDEDTNETDLMCMVAAHVKNYDTFRDGMIASGLLVSDPDADDRLESLKTSMQLCIGAMEESIKEQGASPPA